MISLEEYLAGGETTISNLLLKNYTKLGLDTNEFMLWLQLHAAHQAGEDFPDLTIIAKNMGNTIEKIYGVLNSLVEKEFVTLETALDESGKQSDRYNLMPAYEKLNILKEQERFEAEEKNDLAAQKKMLRSFEQEFGRPLSPIEYQKIGYWLNEDHYSPSLIELALQEAVLNQAYNFKYIETVLQSWEKKIFDQKCRWKRNSAEENKFYFKRKNKIILKNFLKCLCITG